MNKKLAKRSYIHIRENGLVSFVVDASIYIIGHIIGHLPEPYSTRFAARGEIMLEHIRVFPSDQLSITDHIRAVRYGFTPKLFLLYRLDQQGDPSDYLDEVSRNAAKLINDSPKYLDNKKLFYSYLSEIGLEKYLPDIYSEITSDRSKEENYSIIRNVLDINGYAVIKRFTGGGGTHVYICTLNDNEIELHGKSGESCDFEGVIENEDNYLVTEYCEQGSYISDIYPHSTNTIRILTFRLDSNEIIIPAAVHRIGSKKTGMLDNFSQGGMSSFIDINTGKLGPAAEPLKDQHPNWHDVHPDTGVQIKGVTIPQWDRILNQIHTIASQAERFDYVGWDIVVTKPGEFKIIEANSRPDPDVIQVHKPLSLLRKRLLVAISERERPRASPV